MSKRLSTWVRDRLGWDRVATAVQGRTVQSDSLTLYLGGTSVLLFAFLVASGVLLLLHYQPTADYAHESVARIAGEYPYGDLVRGFHYWSGHLLVAALGLQLLSSVLRRTFTPPRELVWWSGIAVFVLCVILAFTGSVLPWSRDAYFNARVGSQMAGQIPIIGGTLLRLLRGGEDVTSITLYQVYGFHVAVLPAAFTTALSIHGLLLWRAPKTRPAAAQGASGIPVYPDFMVRLAAVAVGVLVLVMSLATFAAPSVGVGAGATAPGPEAVRPAWYFLFIHSLLETAPPTLLGVDSPKFIGGALTGVFLVLFALPLLDRKGSRVTAGLAFCALVICVLLTIHAIS